MFGFSTSKNSPVRQRVEGVGGVRRTWIEWEIHGNVRSPVLVVEYDHDLDPASADFRADDFAQVMPAVGAPEAGEVAPQRVRFVPCVATG